MRDQIKVTLTLVFAAFMLASCAPNAPRTEAQPSNTSSPPTATLSSSPTRSPVPTDTSTPTSEPSPTLTETPAPEVSVSMATNCRTGPAESFPLEAVLEVGETVQVAARAEGLNYLLVTNPDHTDQHCWLWAEFATVEGETEGLPVHTPAPSPTPLVGFELFVHSFQECAGDTRLVLIVRNAGARRLMTAEWGVFDIDTGDFWLPPRFERHPFADTSVACPPGHGNRLEPGAGAFIILPLGSPPSGHFAYATIKLCSEDYLAGDCAAEEIYFTFP